MFIYVFICLFNSIYIHILIKPNSKSIFPRFIFQDWPWTPRNAAWWTAGACYGLWCRREATRAYISPCFCLFICIYYVYYSYVYTIVYIYIYIYTRLYMWLYIYIYINNQVCIGFHKNRHDASSSFWRLIGLGTALDLDDDDDDVMMMMMMMMMILWWYRCVSKKSGV